MTKITTSLIKADVGWLSRPLLGPPSIDRDCAVDACTGQKVRRIDKDFRVRACGDDLERFMSHKKGCDNSEVHALAREAFEEASEMAKKTPCL
ncbi:MAG: fructose 1,6-bisphosphatase [Methanothrix sp.]